MARSTYLSHADNPSSYTGQLSSAPLVLLFKAGIKQAPTVPICRGPPTSMSPMTLTSAQRTTAVSTVLAKLT